MQNTIIKTTTHPLKLVILGAGNIASHLVTAFTQTPSVEVVQVYNRSAKNLESFKYPTTTSLSELMQADVYILAVKDDAIAELSSKLPSEIFVVHASGAKPMSELKNTGRKGVFYPLQSFTKGISVNFKDIPICLEAESDNDYKTLKVIAQAISNNVFNITSRQREALHLGAVFVNNFSNYMYTIAEDLFKTHNVPFEVLHPLILETARKATINSPRDNQTGPAIRKDHKTIEKHLEHLGDTNFKDIYKLLTEGIQNQNRDNS